MLEALVDGYAAALEAMEEATDALTSALFDDRPMGKAEQLRAFRMRQAISHLRKVATPMTEITASLAGAATRTPNEQDDDPVADLLTPSTAAGSPIWPITPGTPPTAPPGSANC